MRTAVDSSVLLDVVGADPRFGPRSKAALRTAYDRGALIACDVVWAELRAHYPSDGPFDEAVEALTLRFDPLDPAGAKLAGELWRECRRGSRVGRDRVVADFLIGAHALLRADALLTRDRGFYRRFFQSLHVIDPTEK